MELRAAEKGISLNYRLTADPMMVQADAQQLEQVLINILKNSIEAIDPGSGGRIEVRTETSPGRLIIRDTGKGIPAEVGQNLFTSFYSTKKDGQGIGLTLIREILMNHGFEFSLQSREGFTEFTIEFNG